MQIWHASSILALTAGVLIAASPAPLHAETTEEAYQRLARGISGLTYGDFIWQRPAPFYCDSNPDLKASFEHLDQAMAVKPTLAELAELAKHPEPRVRTLAMMRLYNMEEPSALRVIFSLRDDQEATFPGRSFLTQDHESNRMLLDTTPCTVGKLASLMLEQAGFPPLGMGDAAIGPMIEDWTGWYQYIYLRATGNTSPIRAERTPKIAAVRKKIDALPPTTRAWMLLAIGTIDLDTNENRDPRENLAPLFATEEELIAAAKQLGPDVLITFLRDGSRTGLRDPKCNGPKEDRGFILDHAGELFRKKDAETLKSMGELIAAADADVEQASQVLHEELDRRDKERSGSGKGEVIAALLDLCGNREGDFITRLFYEGLDKDYPSYEKKAFIHELKRRKPKEWRNTFRKIVGHSGFERLDKLTLVYFARLTAELGKTSILTHQDNRDLPLSEIRNLLRAYFSLPEVSYRTLQERIESVKPPMMTAKLPANAEFFELSPDGSMIAAVPWGGKPVPWDEPVRLFSTLDGKPMGALTGADQVRALHFDRTQGRIQTLNDAGWLQTWDIASNKEISRNQSGILNGYKAIFSKSGDFLIYSDQGFTAYDLDHGKPRWKIETSVRGSGTSRLSPDDRRLAIGDGFGKTIRFLDAATGKPVATLIGHGDDPLGAEFSPDGTVFFSRDENKIIIWDGNTGEFQREFNYPSGFVPWCLCAVDSGHFACPTEPGKIALFDVKTGIATRAFTHSAEIGQASRCHTKDLKVTADGKRLIGLIDYSTGTRGQTDTFIECWDLTK